MQVVRVDLDAEVLEVEGAGTVERFGFSTPEAFSILSKLWLRLGWDTKYVYGFSWMGRPVIQLPEDLVRMQEVVYRVQPDVIIETGIAHGGSLMFYATLCRAMGHGRVIGIDVEIRPHNRAAIENHELFEHIELIEGDSAGSDVIALVKSRLETDDRVLVSLDSLHTKEHVLAELEAYAPLVAVDSYIVAADGIMADVVGAPRTEPDWSWNNPRSAAEAFALAHDDFILEQPIPPFNEGTVNETISYWSGGWLRRVR